MTQPRRSATGNSGPLRDQYPSIRCPEKDVEEAAREKGAAVGVTYHSMVTSVDSDVMRLLGDPLRSRIVALLAGEALCVCHLVEETGAKQTNLSNHLKALREAGIVETEPCGRYIYYKLVPAAVEAIAQQLAGIAAVGRETVETGRRRPCP